jgi:periplasmic copper chaperone A
VLLAIDAPDWVTFLKHSGKKAFFLALFTLALVALLIGCGVDGEGDSRGVGAGSLTISGAWSRPVALLEDEHQHSADAEATAGEMDMTAINGVVYLTIENSGDSADRLLSATSDVAEAVELHNVNMVDGVMQMRQVEGGVEIPAGGTTVFEPSGLHIMLIGLNRSLEIGDIFDVELKFEHAGMITVQSEVKDQS